MNKPTPKIYRTTARQIALEKMVWLAQSKFSGIKDASATIYIKSGHLQHAMEVWSYKEYGVSKK